MPSTNVPQGKIWGSLVPQRSHKLTALALFIAVSAENIIPNGLYCPYCTVLRSTYSCNATVLACTGEENQCLNITGSHGSGNFMSFFLPWGAGSSLSLPLPDPNKTTDCQIPVATGDPTRFFPKLCPVPGTSLSLPSFCQGVFICLLRAAPS